MHYRVIYPRCVTGAVVLAVRAWRGSGRISRPSTRCERPGPGAAVVRSPINISYTVLVYHQLQYCITTWSTSLFTGTSDGKILFAKRNKHL